LSTKENLWFVVDERYFLSFSFSCLSINFWCYPTFWKYVKKHRVNTINDVIHTYEGLNNNKIYIILCTLFEINFRKRQTSAVHFPYETTPSFILSLAFRHHDNFRPRLWPFDVQSTFDTITSRADRIIIVVVSFPSHPIPFVFLLFSWSNPSIIMATKFADISKGPNGT